MSFAAAGFRSSTAFAVPRAAIVEAFFARARPRRFSFSRALGPVARPLIAAMARLPAPSLTRAQAAAFRSAVLPHLDSAYAYAMALTRGDSAAEDIVHDAFLRAMRAFPDFRGGGAAKAWLLAIVRRGFLDWLRREGRRRLDLTLEDVDVADDVKGPDALYAEAETVGRMNRLIAALPGAWRETLILREIEGLSYHEIAATVEAPIGTVMSRLARARKALAEAWRSAEGPQ